MTPRMQASFIDNEIEEKIQLRARSLACPINKKSIFKTINEASNRNWFKFRSLSGWFKLYRTLPTINKSSALVPDELIASGCNSAVWSAKVDETSELNAQNHDERMNQLAVKVLYNYYASKDPSAASLTTIHQTKSDESHDSDVLPPDWILLHRQIQRECELRPQTDHPNIVPLIGHFIDRAPLGNGSTISEVQNDQGYVYSQSTDNGPIDLPSNLDGRLQSSVKLDGQKIWAGAESFPEGFGGQPLTAYLIMPRFEATLEDLLKGSWPPHHSSETNQLAGSNVLQDIINSDNPPGLSSLSSVSDKSHVSTSTSSELNSVPLPVDDAVAILAQLFDAVSELETHGIAHRDIKPNNILLRERSASDLREELYANSIKEFSDNQDMSNYVKKRQMDWLNDAEVSQSNAKFHVAITDFGCAIRTRNASSSLPYLERFLTHRNSEMDQNLGTLDHSGNTVLLAPEIASRNNSFLRPHDYEKTDLWAVATLAYPLFGLPNPFISGRLSSKSYSEKDLPPLPKHTPGIVKWLVSECLKRKPNFRPAASLVADVLHVWCLIRRFNRQIRQNSTMVNPNTGNPSREAEDSSNEWEASRDSAIHDVEEVFTLNGNPLPDRLYYLLNIFWASDWITGAGRPPQGIRSNFYSRITPARLLLCLKTVYEQEDCQAHQLARLILDAAGIPF